MRRVLVAAVGVPIAVGVVLAGGGWLVGLLALLGGIGAWELFRIAQRNDLGPLPALGVPIAAALPLYVWLDHLETFRDPLALAAVVFVALLAAVLWARSPDERPLASVSVTATGAVYAGGTLSFAVLLRHHRFVADAMAGSVLLFLPVAITWATDIGAFFVGRLLGGRHLMPTVSPGKTVSGAVGGTVAAVAMSVVYARSILPPYAQLTLAPWAAVVFGLVLSGVAQVGDLFESLLKRSARVKDSSHLLPGHGGVMDRLDSLYFVLPVAYFLLERLLLAAPSAP